MVLRLLMSRPFDDGWQSISRLLNLELCPTADPSFGVKELHDVVIYNINITTEFILVLGAVASCIWCCLVV